MDFVLTLLSGFVKNHEDIAVLSRFCAEVITQSLTHTQNAPQFEVTKKIANKPYQGALNIIVLGGGGGAHTGKD